MLHFSHLHSLELYNSSVQNQVDGLTFSNPVCEACKLIIFENVYYTCKLCTFNFHFNCAQFPELMNHPSHPFHTLKLRPTAAYSGGVFNCDACNRPGNGFSYHCSSCEFDLHMLCAAKPLKIIHELHSCMLELTYVKNPYGDAKGFSCNVCGKVGVKEWMYRCGGCEFDVHLDCTESRNVFGGVQRPFPIHGDPYVIPSPISVLHNRPFSGLTGHIHEFNMPNQAANHLSILQPKVTPTGSVQSIEQPNVALNNSINVGNEVLHPVDEVSVYDFMEGGGAYGSNWEIDGSLGFDNMLRDFPDTNN